MTNLGRKIEIFIVVVAIAFVGIIYAFRKPVLAPTHNNQQSQNQNQDDSQDAKLAGDSTTQDQAPKEQQPQQQLVPASIIEYKGVDGKNALELLKASHRVEAKEYSFGSFITSINGVEPDASHFWALYINGQFSQVAADKYVTKSTDTMKWQIDEVK